jgi:hypothetical protein
MVAIALASSANIVLAGDIVPELVGKTMYT